VPGENTGWRSVPPESKESEKVLSGPPRDRDVPGRFVHDDDAPMPHRKTGAPDTKAMGTQIIGEF